MFGCLFLSIKFEGFLALVSLNRLSKALEIISVLMWWFDLLNISQSSWEFGSQSLKSFLRVCLYVLSLLDLVH